MEPGRLLLRAAGKILRVLRVPLVEHLPRKVTERLARREPHCNVGYPFIGCRQVMRPHADGPSLRLRDLVPVRVAQVLEYTGGFLSLGLELPGKCFTLSSHGVLPWCGLHSKVERTA